MTALLFPPTPELVAVSWLSSLPFIAGADPFNWPPIGVATSLPDRKSWTDAFVVVERNIGEISGGQTDYIPLYEPVMQIGVYSAPKTINSDKPRWNRAANLAQWIRDATYGSLAHGRITVSGEAGIRYDTADLGSVSVQRGPRRMRNDVAALAKYSLDLSFLYAPTTFVAA